jgi:hypothetical protein
LLTSTQPTWLALFWYSLSRKITGGNRAEFRIIGVDSRQLVLRNVRQEDL